MKAVKKTDYDGLRGIWHMTENVSFRSAFNGFNREDVVGYIAGLMEKIKAGEAETTELKKLAEEQKAASEELKRECESLTIKMQQESNLRAALEEQCETQQARIDELERQLGECDRQSRSNEVKLGAAMMDAKRFSEMLVQEANDRAGSVYRAAGESVTRSAARAREIKEQMKALSDEFERTMGFLRKNMNELIDGMADFNEEIKDNGAKFFYQSEFSHPTAGTQE